MKSPELNIPRQPTGPAPEKIVPKHNIEGGINKKWDLVSESEKLAEKQEVANAILKALTLKQEGLLKQVSAYKYHVEKGETAAMSADVTGELRSQNADILAADKALLVEYEKQFTDVDVKLQNQKVVVEELAKKINATNRELRTTDRNLDTMIPDTEEAAINNQTIIDYKPEED